MDLATGSAICNQAIQFVIQKKEQLQSMEKIDERLVEEAAKEIVEEDKTTSGIF
jgi:hypothetical protein